MNIVQEIMVAFFKYTYFGLFEGSLSEREEQLIKNIKLFAKEKALRIGKSYEGKPIIIWDSDIDRSVACYVRESGFLFSKTEIYKTMKGDMKGSIEKNFPGDTGKEQLLKKEIDEIKSILMTFSIDVEVYFK